MKPPVFGPKVEDARAFADDDEGPGALVADACPRPPRTGARYVMDGSSSSRGLASLLLSDAESGIHDAVKVASHMSISDVVSALAAEVSAEHSELCEAFLDKWLESLPPVERLSAVMAAGELYADDLLWLPFSEDRYLQRVLSATAYAIEDSAAFIAEYRGAAESPDTEFDLAFYDAFLARTRGPSRELVAELRAGAVAIQHLDDVAAKSGCESWQAGRSVS